MATNLGDESELRCTTDYGLFTHLKGNRPIDQKEVDKIAASMKEVGFKKAFFIVVDPEGRVKIGQHRLMAAEQAGVPVWYMVDSELTIQQMQDSESLIRKWTIMDFVSSYAELGNPDFIKLKATYDNPEWPIAAISYFWQRAYDVSVTTFADHIRKGTFVFSPARKVRFDELQRKVNDLILFNPKMKKRANAIEATLILVCHPDYEHRKMLNKLEYLASRMVVCASREEYVRMLFDIYNYKSREDNIISPLGKFARKR
jgi:hypothetical protein